MHSSLVALLPLKCAQQSALAFVKRWLPPGSGVCVLRQPVHNSGARRMDSLDDCGVCGQATPGLELLHSPSWNNIMHVT